VRHFFIQCTYVGQSAEWGMGQFQASFPRIIEKIKWQKNEDMVEECYILLKIIQKRAFIPELLKDPLND
jgi:hypothetical protein